MRGKSLGTTTTAGADERYCRSSYRRNRNCTLVFSLFLALCFCERMIQVQYYMQRRYERRSTTTITKTSGSNTYGDNYYYSYDLDWLIDHRISSSSTTDHSSTKNTNEDPSEAASILSPAMSAKFRTLLHSHSIREYQTKVNTSNAKHTEQCKAVGLLQQRTRNVKSGSGNHAVMERVNVQRAMECVQMTRKSHDTQQQQQYIYPFDDADEHYNTIRRTIAQYTQYVSNHTIHTAKKYSGPWIENRFSTYFESMYDDNYSNQNRTATKHCLFDFFGPYIPIFIPWVDHLVQNHHSGYPPGLVETLQSLLRPNVLYLTVSQNDEGITGKSNLQLFNLSSIPNLIVLSAGGYGHVPIPLLKQEEEYVDNNSKSRLRRIPVEDRTIEISYVGSLKNAPYGMRRKMHEIMIKQNTTIVNRPIKGPQNVFYQYYFGPQWREVVINSKFSLVPRGFGRSAYHLMEVLQMGYIPIYVYLSSSNNDPKWIPYADIYDQIGYSCTIDELDDFITMLHNTVSDDEIRLREERIAQLRSSHFTYTGVLQQIHQFMIGDESSINNDLKCQPLPATVTGKQ